MQYVKKSVSLILFVLLALSACQDNDDIAYLSQSLENVSGDNEAAKSLFVLLQQQKDAYVGIKKVLGSYKPKFELTEIGSTSIFGPFYIFPYTDGKEIEGSIIIPMDEGIPRMESRSLVGQIGTPIRMDSDYLNNRIPKFSRFLYSYYFLNWKNHGEQVEPPLSQFAQDISQDKVQVTEEEIKTVMKSGGTRVGSIYERMGNMRIEFNLVYYRAPSSTDEVEVVALNQKVLEDIFKEAFLMNENMTFMKFVDFAKGYRLMSVQFLITDKRFYNNTIEYSIRKILERVRQKVYEKGFNITFHYTYNFPPQSIAFPDTGGNGGGSSAGGGGTGGTPSGSVTGKPKKDDEKDFVIDCSSAKVQYKDTVNNIVGSVKNAKADNKAYQAITWSDYLNTVKDAKIEHSTRLEKYPGTYKGSPADYQLKPIISGTETKVENVATKYTLAEVHNHPNGTPPSFQDVLYTAKQAADTAHTTYQATFVYEAKEDAFYAIYIHDRQKAAKFYEEIKEQVDSVTMMFYDDSEIYRLLKQHSISSNSKFLKYQLSAVFELMDSGISFYKVENKSITSYDVNKTADAGRTKITFIKCP